MATSQRTMHVSTPPLPRAPDRFQTKCAAVKHAIHTPVPVSDSLLEATLAGTGRNWFATLSTDLSGAIAHPLCLSRSRAADEAALAPASAIEPTTKG